MEQSSLAYILDLQIAVVVRYIYIFAFCRYAFQLKVGYFFLSKGAKFPGIFSRLDYKPLFGEMSPHSSPWKSSLHFLQLYQNNRAHAISLQGLSVPLPFSGDSLYYWRHFIEYRKLVSSLVMNN